MRHLWLFVAIVQIAACSKESKDPPAAAATGSAAPKALEGGSAAPAVASSADENALRLASTGKKPYHDKQILKTAIVEPWKAGEADGKKHEELVAAVTVYDPSNRKCWAWNRVAYRRFPPDPAIVQHEVSYKDADIAEVGCATVGFTPPAAPKKKHASASGSSCPRGQTRCNGNCTNLENDRMNCGSCGHECTGEKFACGNHRCW